MPTSSRITSSDESVALMRAKRSDVTASKWMAESEYRTADQPRSDARASADAAEASAKRAEADADAERARADAAAARAEAEALRAELAAALDAASAAEDEASSAMLQLHISHAQVEAARRAVAATEPRTRELESMRLAVATLQEEVRLLESRLDEEAELSAALGRSATTAKLQVARYRKELFDAAQASWRLLARMRTLSGARGASAQALAEGANGQRQRWCWRELCAAAACLRRVGVEEAARSLGGDFGVCVSTLCVELASLDERAQRSVESA